MWTLAQSERRKYPRNSLESVVVQVRFHPILKLPARVGEFQERVREHFPGFLDESLRSVDLFPDGNAHIRTDRLFRFSNAGALRQLQLTMSSLTIEVKNYDRREDLAADFSLGLQALTKGIGEASLYRLGIRFVNVLVREKIGADLGRDVPWSELVTEEFLRVPPLFDAEPPRNYHELTSALPPGALTLRYGLLPHPHQPSPLCFRFDMDRYLEGVIEPHSIDSTLAGFTDDCLSLFEAAVGPSLREWMEGVAHGA